MPEERLSATTLPVIDRPLDEAFGVIADAGFRKVDLLGRGEHFSPDPEKFDPDAVVKLAGKHGLTIANLATYGGKGFTSDDVAEQQREWDTLCRCLDIAEQMGARSIRVYAIGSANERAEHLDRIVPWYRKACEIAERKGVYMGVENHGGAISGDAEACRRLSELVGSKHFGVLYDPCNIVTVGGDYRSAFETFKDHVVHVHIKDGVNEKASQHHIDLGEGDVDVAEVLRQLESIGYEGEITMEYELKTTPPEEGLKRWHVYMTEQIK